MGGLLEKAGASFLRAFLGSLVVLAPGILAAPNLNRGVALGIAALIASIAAGLKSVQAYVPRLSVVGYIHDEKWKPAGAIADSFLRAFIATFLTSVIGILNMPSLSGWKSLVVAALVGAFTAGVKTVEGGLTKGEWPLRDQGFAAPKAAPAVEAVPEGTTVISA
jgi:hypothetical protein